MVNIDKIIKDEKKRQNISSLELANRIGCTKRMVNYWEKKRSIPSVEKADLILKALGISVTIGGEKDGRSIP